MPLSSSIGLQVHPIHHGQKQCRHALAVALETDPFITDNTQCYLGIKSLLSTTSPAQHKENFSYIAPYGGLRYAIHDILSLDVGYKHTYYTSIRHPQCFRHRHQNEGIVGFLTNIPLNPSLYLSHIFEKNETTIEGAVGHITDLGQLLSGLTVETVLNLGYHYHSRKKFVYTELFLTLVYEITDHATLRAGIFAGAHSAKKNFYTKRYGYDPSFTTLPVTVGGELSFSFSF